MKETLVSKNNYVITMLVIVVTAGCYKRGFDIHVRYVQCVISFINLIFGMEVCLALLPWSEVCSSEW